RRFAVPGKNFADTLAGARLNDVIGVEEGEMQLLGDQLAHGGFAGSHEADERNVLNVTLGAHPIELPDLGRNRTKNCPGEHRTPNAERRTSNAEGEFKS